MHKQSMVLIVSFTLYEMQLSNAFVARQRLLDMQHKMNHCSLVRK